MLPHIKPIAHSSPTNITTCRLNLTMQRPINHALSEVVEV